MLKSKVRDIFDFPKKGIVFKDITPLLQDKKALNEIVEILYNHYKNKNIDVVAGIDARGFILGPILAYKLGVGFVPIRKAGKLPYRTISETYALEYGFDEVCVHEDAFKAGENVLVTDDLLATGGTLSASCKLVEKLGANVFSIAVLIDLEFLHGRDKLKNYDIFSVIKY